MSGSNIRILLVEDEKHLAEGLLYNFRAEGYEAVLAKDGQEALELFEKGPWNILVVDLMLPVIDGFEVVKRIRSKEPRVPMLILTAKAGEKDRVKGLECGADDYITKPFHLKELMLRIKGMLKRSSWYMPDEKPDGLYRFGDGCWVDFKSRRAEGPSGKRLLTEKEINILQFLVEREPETVSREEMLETIWGYSRNMETRTIDNFIHRLRTYFEQTPSEPKHIISVRGWGYRFQR